MTLTTIFTKAFLFAIVGFGTDPNEPHPASNTVFQLAETYSTLFHCEKALNLAQANAQFPLNCHEVRGEN